MTTLKEWKALAKSCINTWDLANKYPDVVIWEGGEAFAEGKRWRRAGKLTRQFAAEMPANYGCLELGHGMRCWVPVPLEEARRPCTETCTIPGRWATFHPCDRPAKDERGLCGLHAGVKERADAKDAAWKERNQRSNDGSKIARDGVAALATIDVKGSIHYHVPIGPGMGSYTGEVLVHAEDIIALVRELKGLREMAQL